MKTGSSIRNAATQRPGVAPGCEAIERYSSVDTQGDRPSRTPGTRVPGVFRPSDDALPRGPRPRRIIADYRPRPDAWSGGAAERPSIGDDLVTAAVSRHGARSDPSQAASLAPARFHSNPIGIASARRSHPAHAAGFRRRSKKPCHHGYLRSGIGAPRSPLRRYLCAPGSRAVTSLRDVAFPIPTRVAFCRKISGVTERYIALFWRYRSYLFNFPTCRPSITTEVTFFDSIFSSRSTGEKSMKRFVN